MQDETPNIAPVQNGAGTPEPESVVPTTTTIAAAAAAAAGMY